MKHIILLSILLSIAMAYTGKAQTNRGIVMLSFHNFSPEAPEAEDIFNLPSAAGISFGKLKDGNSNADAVKYYVVGMSGSVNYFFANDLSAGLTFNVRGQKVTEIGNDDYDYKTRLFMFGPVIHYFIPLKKHAKVWLSGSGSFGSSQFRYGGNDPEIPIQLAKYGAGTGIAIFLQDKCSIDLGLELNLFKAERNNKLDMFEETNTSLTFDIGVSVFLSK